MASTPRTPRRGLPRVPGGEPWPPAASGVPEASAGARAGSSQNGAGLAGSGPQGAGIVTDSEQAFPDAAVSGGGEVPGAAAGSSQNGGGLAGSGPRSAGIVTDSEQAFPDAAVSSGGEVPGAAAGSSQNGADLADPGPRSAGIVTNPEQASPDAADAVAQAAPHLVATAASVTDSPTPSERPVRRGLPREPGGEPWPAASARAAGAPDAPPVATASHPRPDSATSGISGPNGARPSASDRSDRAGVDVGSTVFPTPTDAATAGVRRGLPRESGGEPWPPASAPVASARDARSVSAAERDEGEATATADFGAPAAGAASADELDARGSERASAPESASSATTGPSTSTRPEQAARSAGEGRAPRPPLTVPRTVWPGAAARRTAAASTGAGPTTSTGAAARRAGPPGAAAGRSTATAAARMGDFSPLQLLGSAAVLGVFAFALAGIVVLLARFVLALGPGQEFLAAYPGEYPLPDAAPVGIPAWLNWSHFLNSFFLLFIIRTGWQVRSEKRPSAFWSPRKNKRRRISLTLWFHQAVDILWIANGVIFVVLLFATGQWMRIVPTSWDVFPNALSAALQYASLDWPTENGWVNYNSLQQLSYFAITFLAAPLAILSGVRLSGVWPKDAEKLNRLYPLEWARRVHFPVMLFFVAFIVVHVGLVLATGALRNLDHMYAARGSIDPDAFASDPTGLLIFAASLLVMAAGLAAARPRVLVPIARLFGEVKQR
ncbi:MULTISPECIES: cytochrome b/b6 domain-containing protein [Microbacterium]|uniref:cytochrome b/b6 domain-containing protein n=1 Tax=Microbacterium TaxID=33882 RepID=UPI00277D1AFF|nr:MULTISPECIES: cytochrome b/b6 domain-containing protein [Microbacterium]MDQ1085289.1 thiosulfate reductase cytochrome b subunit [Microbacterium sp. SORGH_AS_0344]MDQ1169404.1 thiosulfate reductase cytochrome b subunit [Microbacterium proteolyticum]